MHLREPNLLQALLVASAANLYSMFVYLVPLVSHFFVLIDRYEIGLNAGHLVVGHHAVLAHTRLNFFGETDHR